jgi:hypothetical protein
MNDPASNDFELQALMSYLKAGKEIKGILAGTTNW